MNKILELNRAEKLLLFDNISKKIFSKKDSWEATISKKIFEGEYRAKSSREIQNKIQNIIEKNDLINQEFFEILLKLLVKTNLQ